MLELATVPSEEWTRESADALTNPGRGRFDPFRVLDDEERARELAAYEEFMRRREGDIDWDSWTLPARERRLRTLRDAQVDWKGHIDTDAFYQHFHRVGSPEVDIQTHWAILTAIANESERYGVELEARELQKQGRDADPVKVYHVLQEDHHTALLLECCRTLGLEGVTLLAPRRVHRWVIRAMAHLPDSMRYSLILMGEAIGSVVMKHLGETAYLFSDDPAVAKRLRQLYTEIVDDERLHAMHCRARSGRWSLALARLMMPIASFVSVLAYPQIRKLGIDHRKLTAEIRRGIEIPSGVDWIEPDAEAIPRTT